MKEINTWPGWESVRLIGRGSFGSVYEIQRQEYGRIYTAALKVITISGMGNNGTPTDGGWLDNSQRREYYQSLVESILKECALMYDFKGYTNFVSYEDHMVIENEDLMRWDILIRMELLQPLESWMELNGHTLTNIAQIGVDICTALDIFHKRNLIHRDIKPENIFVNTTGNFKLGDFGIARSMENVDTVMSRKGTLSYMAPEIFLGDKYSFPSDIYSLGIVLYRYLNGRPPFIEKDRYTVKEKEIALARQMRGEPIPYPERGSDEFRRVVMKSISFKPEERYQSAEEFKKALLKCPEIRFNQRDSYIRDGYNKTVQINNEPGKLQIYSKIIIAAILVICAASAGIILSVRGKQENTAKKNDIQTATTVVGVSKVPVVGESDEQSDSISLLIDSDVMVSGTQMAIELEDSGFIITDMDKLNITSSNTNVAYIAYDEDLHKNVVFALEQGSTTITAEYEGKKYSREVTVYRSAEEKYGISLDPLYDSVILHETFSTKKNYLRFILSGCNAGDIDVHYYYNPELILECSQSWEANEMILEMANKGSQNEGQIVFIVTNKGKVDVVYSICKVNVLID